VLWALTAATVVAASTLLIPLRVVNLQEWKPRAGSSSVGARLREALNDVRGLAPTWPVTVVSFLAFAVIGLVYTYLVVDLRHRFGWSNGSVIGLLFLYGLANVAGNLALGRLGDRSGKERAVRVGQITELAALIVLALALWQDARIMLVAALCVFAFGQAYIPNLKALASAVRQNSPAEAWPGTTPSCTAA
jgi:predicted MFS family arabinose efflux permease